MESSTAKAIKKSCCKDEVVVVEGQNKLNLNVFDDLNSNQQQFLTAYVYSYISLFISLPKQVIQNQEYAPPNIIYDIQLLDETFLI